MQPESKKHLSIKHLSILAAVAAAFFLAGMRPDDELAFFLELLPVVVGCLVLLLTYRRFRFTTFVYGLMAFQIMVALVGAHYTSDGVPGFSWLQEQGIFVRNNYDKFGHFIQGFVPAMIIREILLRKTALQSGRIFNTMIVSVALATSALYEISEYGAAVTLGADANEFLGMQGFIWDTQTDMLFAFVGAISALLLLSRRHDRALGRTCFVRHSPELEDLKPKTVRISFISEGFNRAFARSLSGRIDAKDETGNGGYRNGKEDRGERESKIPARR